MNSLIVGIDGQIGSSLNNIIDGNILGTTIFPELLSDKCRILDLSENISSWQPPDNIDVAYICAAICSIKECEEETGVARKVNVDNTVELAKKLVGSGAFVVFPSTNMVFDGAKPDYCENDNVCPLNEYGKQKVEAEKELLKIGNCAIVRFTKVIGPNFPLIKNWINDLKNNVTVHPFSNMKMAPVSLKFAAKMMKKIGESKSTGIWHVSNNEEVTYEEVAKHIAKKINVSDDLIRAVKAKEITNIPDYTTLDSEKIYSEFNMKTPDVFTLINAQFNL